MVELKQIFNSFEYFFGYVGIQILMTVFGCTVNKIFAVILKYFVFNYKFKSISVINLNINQVF